MATEVKKESGARAYITIGALIIYAMYETLAHMCVYVLYIRILGM